MVSGECELLIYLARWCDSCRVVLANVLVQADFLRADGSASVYMVAAQVAAAKDSGAVATSGTGTCEPS